VVQSVGVLLLSAEKEEVVASKERKTAPGGQVKDAQL
jgi:hypothetical protein